MTNAPANLKAARSLLLTHLDIHENSTAYATDLDPAEVGIVGGPNHFGGYHCGSDRVVSGDYSVVESSRDRNSITLDAAALDVGSFEIRVGGKAHNLRSFSVWLTAQCKANTVDSRDIREVIYSGDGQTVKRWDRLAVRSSGDSSHLWHTHISFHRDAVKAGRDLTPLFRRYLTEIGLLAGEDDDMPSDFTNETVKLWDGALTTSYQSDRCLATGSPTLPGSATQGGGQPHWLVGQVRTLVPQVAVLTRTVEQLAAALQAGGSDLDTAAVLARIDQRAAEDAQRDAEHAEQLSTLQAERDELTRRLAEALTGTN